jgi:hypothetical protein
MKEDYLQFAWRTLSFKHVGLKTRSGQTLRILDPGIQNTNQGPDFQNAVIRLGKTEHHGHIEVHMHGDEWFRHGHHRDPMYNNTILHVVYEKGEQVATRLDGTQIPELIIANVLDTELLERYNMLRRNMEDIPCKGLMHAIPGKIMHTWFDALAMERLQQKADVIRAGVAEKNWDWGQAYFQALAKCFGGTLNGDAFEYLAGFIPFHHIRKYHAGIVTLEAILLGTAGFLNRRHLTDPYEKQLKSEWLYYKRKHGPQAPEPIPFKYMRMRPAAFPDIRLAQLANFLHVYPEPGLFSDQKNRVLLKSGKLSASSYWDTRFRFATPSDVHKPKIPGDEFLNLLTVNVLFPFGLAMQNEFGHKHLDQAEWKDYRMMPPEHNRITRTFAALGFQAQDAAGAQGQIQLYKHFCLKKMCLQCAAGRYLLSGQHLQQDV